MCKSLQKWTNLIERCLKWDCIFPMQGQKLPLKHKTVSSLCPRQCQWCISESLAPAVWLDDPMSLLSRQQLGKRCAWSTATSWSCCLLCSDGTQQKVSGFWNCRRRIRILSILPIALATTTTAITTTNTGAAATLLLQPLTSCFTTTRTHVHDFTELRVGRHELTHEVGTWHHLLDKRTVK